MTELYILGLIALAAIFNAAADTIDDFYNQSIFAKLSSKFWNPLISWQNKWQNGDKSQGENFFGSSTFLVFLTDGWHLSKFLYLASIFGAITIASVWWVGIACIIVWGIFFEIFYRLFKKEL